MIEGSHGRQDKLKLINNTNVIIMGIPLRYDVNY